MEPEVWAKALSHPVRRSIVRQLGACEQLSPSEMAAVVGQPVTNVGYHVVLLKDLGVLREVSLTQVRGTLKHHYTLVDREAAMLALGLRAQRRGLGDMGAAFRRTRERQGVAVAELAERVGIDATELERIEAGEVDSQLELLFKLATALDSTLEEILAEIT